MLNFHTLKTRVVQDTSPVNNFGVSPRISHYCFQVKFAEEPYQIVRDRL